MGPGTQRVLFPSERRTSVTGINDNTKEGQGTLKQKNCISTEYQSTFTAAREGKQRLASKMMGTEMSFTLLLVTYQKNDEKRYLYSEINHLIF